MKQRNETYVFYNFANMKYKVCCPPCDDDECVRGTDKCEAEIWVKEKDVEEWYYENVLGDCCNNKCDECFGNNRIYPEFNKEEANMDIRVGDVVGLRYVGVWVEGVVINIRCSYNRTPYVDIDCGGGTIITHYPADNITSNSSAEKRREGKIKLNSLYGAKVYTPKIKISQTEITGGDRKGLYSTVFFNFVNTDPVTIKKSEDANNNFLLVIAYAYAIYCYGTNSNFKKRIDKGIIKMGTDYAIQLDWRKVFIPGEILKRKRWDIYNYVAVQLLFRDFSIKDIQEAIENYTYTKKEK